MHILHKSYKKFWKVIHSGNKFQGRVLKDTPNEPAARATIGAMLPLSIYPTFYLLKGAYKPKP